MGDLFFDKSYESTNDFTVEVKVDTFDFLHSTGTIRHQFHKREIPVRIKGKIYYDLVTPFSYGGPVITKCNDDDKWELVDEFQRTFQTYCEENDIICESINFDPLLSNVVDFACCYEVECAAEATNNELYIGKKIWNSEVYKKVCLATEVGLDGDFFPAYRRKNLVLQ